MMHYLHELGGLGRAPAAQIECDGRRVIALGLLELASLVLVRDRWVGEILCENESEVWVEWGSVEWVGEIGVR